MFCLSESEAGEDVCDGECRAANDGVGGAVVEGDGVAIDEMAIGEGITTVASAIGAILILILGHGLNMILAGMAVIVHGVRLNMLEYSGHANVEFSGKEYNPFKLKKKVPPLGLGAMENMGEFSPAEAFFISSLSPSSTWL